MAFGVAGLLVVLFIAPTYSSAAKNATSALHRSDFPAGFIFGSASSAYQYEGAAAEGGRRPSIWDTFTHQRPDMIADRSNGDVAIDSYHRYKEDVKIMKNMGWDAYRFSISWTRILPSGSLSGGINQEGIDYYNNLINELISKGLKPFVTLFHWDSPQSLEDSYGGFLSDNIVKDFRDFAWVCYREFGDRVKHWITFNEPLTYCALGYGTGSFAPGRCTPSGNGKCAAGDSAREPYTACHNQLLAHATAVRLYRRRFQAKQQGVIGITLNTNWFIPYSNSKSSVRATKRALDFNFGWFMEPLTRGKYPLTMRKFVGDRLPRFTRRQYNLVKGSFDFIGINYYTSSYTQSAPPTNVTSYSTDSRTQSTEIRNGVLIGPQAASDWLFIYPPGIKELLLYTKTNYNNPVIFITENGVDEINNKTAPLRDALHDSTRIKYFHDHLSNVKQAIREGVNVRGYFAWSLLDNFEWTAGYTVRFGINFVDYENGLKRHPKRSALWFTKFLKS
ncbi:beta-glucosidase 12-like [Typha latifolia]|uniref:beta-glucosidase 12-like n=1 Tax=Typha latifolia TaxID=4733 RepID=UPI003C2F161C